MKITPELNNIWNWYVENRQPGMIEALAIQITEVQKGLVKASMPVENSVKQPFGYLHGGASATLAETIASLGSMMLINPQKDKAAGLEINAQHLSPVRSGTVFAEAILLHEGKRRHIWDISIHDQEDRLVCISRCTVAISKGR